MARTVLKTWGINRCEDVGEMVFHLIEVGAFGKTEEDTRDDFANGYDFDDAFHKPFLPTGKTSRTPVAKKSSRRPSRQR